MEDEDEVEADPALAELEQRVAEGHMLTADELRQLQESAHAGLMEKLEAGYMLTAEEKEQMVAAAAHMAAKDAAGLQTKLEEGKMLTSEELAAIKHAAEMDMAVSAAALERAKQKLKEGHMLSSEELKLLKTAATEQARKDLDEAEAKLKSGYMLTADEMATLRAAAEAAGAGKRDAKTPGGKSKRRQPVPRPREPSSPRSYLPRTPLGATPTGSGRALRTPASRQGGRPKWVDGGTNHLQIGPDPTRLDMRAQTATGGSRASRSNINGEESSGTRRAANAPLLLPLGMPSLSSSAELADRVRRQGSTTARPLTSHSTTAGRTTGGVGSQSARSRPGSRPGSQHASHKQLPRLRAEQKAALTQLKLSAMVLLADGVDVGNLRLGDLADLSSTSLTGGGARSSRGRLPRDRAAMQRKASDQLLLLSAYQPSAPTTPRSPRTPRTGRNGLLSPL